MTSVYDSLSGIEFEADEFKAACRAANRDNRLQRRVQTTLARGTFVARQSNKARHRILFRTSKQIERLACVKNDNNAGGKNWDCSIRLNLSVPEHVLIHEMIHACSASRFGRTVWLNHPWEEELTVHYLSQELAVIQGFAVVDSGYDSGVDLIRDFKAAAGIATSDLEFASELLKQPLGERWDWLATQIFDAHNFDMTVERYQELMDKLEAIRQWTPQK